MPIQEESIFIALNDKDTLHLKRFYQNSEGEPVFLVHGSIENGSIFYSKSKKGYAPFLASQGYDVFVVDLQGRGLSTPAMSKASNYGQKDVIITDLPACIGKIKEIKGDVPLHFGGHSWGGVFILSYLARFKTKAKTIVLFGAKRRLTVRPFEYFFKLIIMWYFLGFVFGKLFGYVPAKALSERLDNEPYNQIKQISAWLGKKAKWIGIDGYDYEENIQKIEVPPSLYLAGKKDNLLGNIIDAKLLMSETHGKKNECWYLAKSDGFQEDYGHIDMLTHRNASTDHFPKIVKWMQKQTA